MDLTSLVQALGGGVQAVIALLVVIVIIVTVHEFGHYIVGRWCGIHAEVFSLGFGRPLWSRIDKRGTRWQVAALPFGGYVRFLGDADAASRPGALPSGLSAEERRHTMQGAPLWARAATVLAGPAFNVALTLILSFGLILHSGVAQDDPVIGGVTAMPTGPNPFQPGDRILSLNGQEITSFKQLGDLADTLKDQPQVTYVVQRGGQTLTLPGPNPRPPLVTAVYPKSAAEAAGLQKGDLFLTVNGQSIAGFDQMPPLVSASEGKPVALSILRDGKTLNLSLSPTRLDLPKADGTIESKWLIGVSGQMLFDPQVRSATLTEAAGQAFEQSWLTAKLNFNAVAQMLRGAISTCNMAGPIGMAKAASAAMKSGLESFIGTLAFMSLTIGLANLLPIPVLDGGHLVFFLYEAVARRAPNVRALQILMTVGFALLLSLMLFAFSNDLFLCR